MYPTCTATRARRSFCLRRESSAHGSKAAGGSHACRAGWCLPGWLAGGRVQREQGCDPVADALAGRHGHRAGTDHVRGHGRQHRRCRHLEPHRRRARSPATTGQWVVYRPPATPAVGATATLTATSGASPPAPSCSSRRRCWPARRSPASPAPSTSATTPGRSRTSAAPQADDCFAVQGYLHARDRLFQMDFLRRVATGTLADAGRPARPVAGRPAPHALHHPGRRAARRGAGAQHGGERPGHRGERQRLRQRRQRPAGRAARRRHRAARRRVRPAAVPDHRQRHPRLDAGRRGSPSCGCSSTALLDARGGDRLRPVRRGLRRRSRSSASTRGRQQPSSEQTFTLQPTNVARPRWR